jgi:hypothetical protein
MVKGHSEPIDLDGVSLSGASGSQAVVIITSAPNVASHSLCRPRCPACHPRSRWPGACPGCVSAYQGRPLG